MTEGVVDDGRHTFDGEFDRLFRRAYSVAYRVLWSREDAEDVAIETLAKASLRWSSIGEDPDPWVTTVAVNRAIDQWRRRRRAPAPERVVEGDGQLGQEAERIDLARSVARLPRRQRQVVTMRYLLDWSEADTADALGCSTGSVKQHLSRGLRSLRLEDRAAEAGPSGGAVDAPEEVTDG